MGNVDGVPMASQVKSFVQAARGEKDAAWATQQRFSEQCIGVAQIRSIVEFSRGDHEAAAETQRQFLATARRVLSRSEIADALPGVAQLKSTALEKHGEEEAAETTRRNFSRRCLGVAQARSLYEALVLDRRDDAVDTQREFFQAASMSIDRVPVMGHAKGWLHHAMGEHDRAGQAIDSANRSVTAGVQFMRMAYHDITTPTTQNSGEHPEGVAKMEAAGPLTPDEIRQYTLRFDVTPEQCLSFSACPICMQEFTPGDTCTTLRCFHIFHGACAQQWLQQSGNCPVCRVQVKASATRAWASVGAPGSNGHGAS